MEKLAEKQHPENIYVQPESKRNTLFLPNFKLVLQMGKSILSEQTPSGLTLAFQGQE